jgi:ATP phosphoribosyltransferase regulatory subunit
LSRSAETLALLPAGLQDVLPPEAQHEAATIERLMAVFARHSYERVKPPLVEFEESLLSGPGAAMSKLSFRLMDPVSQRMMAVRADMTLQVARIAATRLGRQARPLRLSYGGQVLRVKGSDLRPERQFAQAGIELIGSPSPRADVETILLAAEALNVLGIEPLSIDLNLSSLAPAVIAGLGIEGETASALIAALDRRDAAAVVRLAAPHGRILGALLRTPGPAADALAALSRIQLPTEAKNHRLHLVEIVELLLAEAPDLVLTVDPVEHRGLEYHTGIGFTLLQRKLRGELGRGGRYVSAKGEASTGFTLYLDTLMRAMAPPKRERRLFVPAATPRAKSAAWRKKGWITIDGLEPVPDAANEARRLGCTHLLRAGRALAIEE